MVDEKRTRLRRFSDLVRSRYTSLAGPGLKVRQSAIGIIVAYCVGTVLLMPFIVDPRVREPVIPFGNVVVPGPGLECGFTLVIPGFWQDMPLAFWLLVASLIPAWFGWDAAARAVAGAGTALAALYLSVFSGLWLEKGFLGQELPEVTTCSVRPPATQLAHVAFRIQYEVAQHLVYGGAILVLVIASTGPISALEVRFQGWKRILAIMAGVLGSLIIISAWVLVFGEQGKLDAAVSVPQMTTQLLLLTVGGLVIFSSARLRRVGRGAIFLALTLSWAQHVSVSSLQFARDSDDFRWNALGHLEQVIDPQEMRELVTLGHVDDIYSTITFAAVLLIGVALVFAWLYGDIKEMRSTRSEQEPDHPRPTGRRPGRPRRPPRRRPAAQSEPEGGQSR
jgi:hypothetical protein